MSLLELLDLIPLVVLGAVLGIDVVTFPQAMVSRPIVASTAAGALIGQPGRGLAMGVALEFFALETLPFGASRYPEWGSAAVVGGALYAMTPDGTAAAMTSAALLALVAASFSGSSMVLLRRWNGYWAKRQQARITRGSGSAVSALQIAGLSADLGRAGLLTFIGLVVLGPVHRAVIGIFVMSPVVSRAVVVSTASAVGIAAIWKVVRTTTGARWFLLGGLGVGVVAAAGLI